MSEKLNFPMEKIEGFVFPQELAVGDVKATNGGLTTRQYYAAQAMKAIIGSGAQSGRYVSAEGVNIGIQIDTSVKIAFTIADEMIAFEKREVANAG